MTRLEAFGDKLVIHPIRDKLMSSSGLLYIPESAERKSDQGIIVSKGPKVTEDLNVFDHVLFSPYSGDKVSVADSGIFFIIRQDQIVAKMKKSENVLMDRATVLRILEEVVGEYKQKSMWFPAFSDGIIQFNTDFVHRLEQYAHAEGFEW